MVKLYQSKGYFTEFKIAIRTLYILPDVPALKSSPEVISTHDNPIDSRVYLVQHKVTQRFGAGRVIVSCSLST